MALKEKDLLVLQATAAGFALGNGLLGVLRDKGVLNQTDEITVMETALRQLDMLARAIPHPALSGARLQYANQLAAKKKALGLN